MEHYFYKSYHWQLRFVVWVYIWFSNCCDTNFHICAELVLITFGAYSNVYGNMASKITS